MPVNPSILATAQKWADLTRVDYAVVTVHDSQVQLCLSVETAKALEVDMSVKWLEIVKPQGI